MFKNKKGFSDIITVIILCGIIGSLFITSTFVWKEMKIFNISNSIMQISNEEDDSSQLLFDTHAIVRVEEYDDLIWFEIKSLPNTKPDQHELWLQNNMGKYNLINTFSISECDSLDWTLTSDGGIDLTYKTSPCEAFSTKTRILYSNTGTQIFRISHKSSESSFTYKTPRMPEQTVSLLIDGTCAEVFPTYVEEEATVSTVMLQGIKISSQQGESDYMLSVPEEVSCEIGYGFSVLNPSISEPTYDGKSISFELANGVNTVIQLLEEPNVQFNY